MLKVGQYVKVDTVTKTSLHGTVIYRVEEVDGVKVKVSADGPEVPGIKFMMISGSGPAAKPGHVIIDKVSDVAKFIKDGQMVVISDDEAQKLAKTFEESKSSDGSGLTSKHGGTGCVEIDL